MDATLLLCLARRLWREGRQADAVEAVAAAVETLPGDEDLLAFEENIRDDCAASTLAACVDSKDSEQGGTDDTVRRPEALITLDLRAFLFALSVDPEDGKRACQIFCVSAVGVG
jgi:hypothetical protein